MSDSFFKGEGEQGLTLLVIKLLLFIRVCFNSAKAGGLTSLWVEIKENLLCTVLSSLMGARPEA